MAENDPKLKGLDLDALLADGLRESGSHVSSTWEPPSPGDLERVLPRHRILRLIGRGGMGAVYEARQIDLDRRVAIKVLPAELGANHAFAERFRREARALGRLRHPHILEVFEFGESTAGHLFFSMEFVEGIDLGRRLKEGPVPTMDALRWVREICSALEAAHAEGVIHRDIKPSNVLLTANGVVKVGDFGLAVLVDQPEERLTHTGLAMGTFEYSAPEQASGATVDARSDLYSVGVLCYELLTGRLPRGVFDPPSRLNAGVDPGVDAVVLMAMQNDPARRFQKAADFSSALHRTEARPAVASPGPEPRDAPPAAVGPRTSRGSWPWPALGWMAVVVASLAVLGLLQRLTGTRSREGAGLLQVGSGAIPLEEHEIEAAYLALDGPNGSLEAARQWATRGRLYGKELERRTRRIEPTIAFLTAWIARLEDRLARHPQDARWNVALSAMYSYRAACVENSQPKLALRMFEVALELRLALLKTMPEESLARHNVVDSLCNVLEINVVVSPPAVILEVCRHTTAAYAGLSPRSTAEQWFDHYLGASTAKALERVLEQDASARPGVRAAARAALSAIFDRPDVGAVAQREESVLARARLLKLAE